LLDQRDVSEYLQVPAKSFNSVGRRYNPRSNDVDVTHAITCGIETNTARTSLMQTVEFTVRQPQVQGDDRARRRSKTFHRVKSAGVVGPVSARLHDYRAR